MPCQTETKRNNELISVIQRFGCSANHTDLSGGCSGDGGGVRLKAEEARVDIVDVRI